MLNLIIKVAITGGIASGKSSVCRFLKELGAHVVSADIIVHQLLSPNTKVGKQIIELLGEVIVENEQFNRQLIAEKIFNHSSTLKSFEEIIHPEVQSIIDHEYNLLLEQAISNSSHQKSIFVAEVPLLFEKSLEHFYDLTILVVSDESNCRERYKLKTGKDDFFIRNQYFLNDEIKKVKADKVIINNGTLIELKQATQALYQELIS